MSDPMEPAAPAAPVEADASLPEGEEIAPPGTRAMAVVRWLLVALMTAAAVAALTYHFTGGDAGAKRDAHVEYYCPMHPQIVQDAPGDCPICNMTLVARPAAQSAAAQQQAALQHARAASTPQGGSGAHDVPGLAPIQLPPERVQLMGMRIAKVERRALAPELRATGVVSTREQGLARVHTRFAGWIEHLAVAETGARVQRGQVLATVYSPELLAAQHELINAVKWSTPRAPLGAADSRPVPDTGAGLADNARMRLSLLGIAANDIAQIESSGKASGALPLRSPASGYVTRKSAVQGMYLEPGTELFEVADLSRVWVVVDVPEQDLARVRVKARARLVLSALPERSFTGELQFIYPALDPVARTLRVRLEFKNPALELRPGMYGEVLIEGSHAESLAVPADAVVDAGTVRYVFVALPDGVFAPRKVRVGAQAAGFVQLLEGVREGEQVVTSANFLLDSESRLQATQGATGGAAAPDSVPPPPAHGGH
jgi:Cu(I)/Ag(I) efflux system membrane fusion protein